MKPGSSSPSHALKQLTWTPSRQERPWLRRKLSALPTNPLDIQKRSRIHTTFLEWTLDTRRSLMAIVSKGTPKSSKKPLDILTVWATVLVYMFIGRQHCGYVLGKPSCPEVWYVPGTQ